MLFSHCSHHHLVFLLVALVPQAVRTWSPVLTSRSVMQTLAPSTIPNQRLQKFIIITIVRTLYSSKWVEMLLSDRNIFNSLFHGLKMLSGLARSSRPSCLSRPCTLIWQYNDNNLNSIKSFFTQTSAHPISTKSCFTQTWTLSNKNRVRPYSYEQKKISHHQVAALIHGMFVQFYSLLRNLISVPYSIIQLCLIFKYRLFSLFSSSHYSVYRRVLPDSDNAADPAVRSSQQCYLHRCFQSRRLRIRTDSTAERAIAGRLLLPLPMRSTSSCVDHKLL